MNSEIELIRKELLDINYQIAEISKNHRLEGSAFKEANLKLEELKAKQEEIRLRLRHAIYEECQNRGGR